ncbi:3'-5' exonuclease [Aeromonas hydrophila]|uniref:3'-5' exonuclease n=1 Tax=Aeromonas hydrophila TaxID=644 RepID=UPI00398707DA
MKTLNHITPTAEQLTLITLPRPGVRIIRGAAGSGKTTTSILMMKMSLGYLSDYYKARDPNHNINAIVFGFNKTLTGYVKNLVDDTTKEVTDIRPNIFVSTLSKYFYQNTPFKNHEIISPEDKRYRNLIQRLSSNIPLDLEFIIDEIEYLMGKLPSKFFESYIDIERVGRGNKPRVDKTLRRKILDEIVYPYHEYKKSNNIVDWNDIAVYLSENKVDDIDIAVIDEAQDFSANQLRAILNQCSDTAFITIVLDGAQKIYNRGFTWNEVGIKNASYARLEHNYRNTYEIADFALSLLNASNISYDEDSTLPNIKEITRHGEKPLLIEGSFSNQIDWIVGFIKRKVDLKNQTVGFLHPKGGRWFSYLEEQLKHNNLDYEVISRRDEILDNGVNIALSTIHSAKGLEFDFVFIVGVEDRHFVFGEADVEDSNYPTALKLLAMAITRAREFAVITYKDASKPAFLNLFDSKTYNLIRVL